MLSSLTDVQFIPCNCKGPTMWRPLQGATTWRPFSSTSRSLSLFSLQSSSSSTATSPFIVRSSDFSYSSTYASNLKVRVWWDFDTCELPTGVSVSQVPSLITDALKANEINGPVEITAFGNIKNLSIENQEAISSSGIDFNHVEPKDPIVYPQTRQNGVYRAIVSDLDTWVIENDPPWHLLFISGYDNFAVHFRDLVEYDNYNVLVATAGPHMDYLGSFGSIAWDWESLVWGENLTPPLLPLEVEDDF